MRWNISIGAVLVVGALAAGDVAGIAAPRGTGSECKAPKFPMALPKLLDRSGKHARCLGYDVKDGKIVVLEDEAEQVRLIVGAISNSTVVQR